LGFHAKDVSTNLIKSKELIDTIQTLGQSALADAEAAVTTRTDTYNPQIIFKKLKDDILKNARRISKSHTPRKTREINNLKEQIKLVLKEKNLSQEEQQVTSLELEDKIVYLEKSIYTTKCMHVMARNRLEGETISRYWTQLNKEKTPRDTLQMLKYPNTDPPVFERKSQRMAELVRNYHYELHAQDICLGDQLDMTRAAAYDNIL
jgi:hypothetical protein